MPPYHYGEIRTPILEETALFARGVGAETDIVMKEMYTFRDRDDESLTLRPEATASVVRAYIEHSLYNQGGIQKLYYIGPMFRRERPQKGRYRQFYQIGAEVLGSQNPLVDVEVIEMLVLFLERVGIREYQLLINSVGCPTCRAAYLEVLRQALQDVKATMCADCQRRADTNPLRVLDCKVEADQPIIESCPRSSTTSTPSAASISSASPASFRRAALSIRSRRVWCAGSTTTRGRRLRLPAARLGAQNAVVGGGRYDGLSEMLGGPPTPGIGFSIGQDRLILAVQAAAVLQPGNPLAAYVVWMGEATLAPASRLVRELRAQGLSVEIDYDPMKIKKAMGIANKLQARFAIIIGEGELASGKYQVKDMASGEQKELEPSGIAEYVKGEIMNSKF